MKVHSDFLSQHNRKWKEKIAAPVSQTHEIIFPDFWDK